MAVGNYDEVLVFSLTLSDYRWHACNGHVAIVTHDSRILLSRSSSGWDISRCGIFSPLTGGRLSRVGVSGRFAPLQERRPPHLFSNFICKCCNSVDVLMHRCKSSWCAFCVFSAELCGFCLLCCQQSVHNHFCLSAGVILKVQFV